MNSEEARFRAIAALSTPDVRVYEGRTQQGRRALPDLVVMDRATGALSRVRVMVGKRPRDRHGRPSERLYPSSSPVGPHADTVALIDPLSGAVDFRPPPPDMAHDTRQGGNRRQRASTAR